MEEQKIRLNKYLSEIGYCSRRAGDKLIESGRVFINNEVASLGQKINISDEIKIDDKLVEVKTKRKIYLALNKPIGIVCTTDTKVEKDNIIDFINYPERIFPIGRLDKPSSGLILLTNDGDIVNKILRTEHNHEKEYIVKVDKPLSQTIIDRMSKGVPILDTITKECVIKKLSSNEFKIILTQGLNRQIRRMCEYFNYKVVSLDRTRIMNIKLDLPLGEYRELTNEEISSLNKLIDNE
ncbi:MAG: 23S rRNA pseudouridine2604 synthase [Flavobacteriaceae bacterium]|jgi:23S rRNA pseudouridine2604 synthase|tara:strand:+ start:1385 stop:2098 length:714 start_codon:yes stop_codon:yes gene_type:complete